MIKKKTSNFDTFILVLSTLGILIVINFFANNIFFRLDLTENKDYSISEVSINTAANLDDIVNIKVYFSENLPSQYISLKQDVQDILNDYANYSKNKIIVKIINPDVKEETRKELYLLGIPELQFNILEKDKYEVTSGFLGIAIQYGNNTEVIPVIENTLNLEYNLTLAIKKVTSKKLPTIGIYNEISDYSRIINEKLGEYYQVIDVNLIDEEDTKDKLTRIDTLISIRNTTNMPDESLMAIDEFIMNGGALLALSEGVNITDNLSGSSNLNNFHKLIEEYGIRINNNLVLDNQSGFTSFSQGFVSFMLNYPLWPKINKDGFDQDHAAVSKLESLVLPWVSSLELTNTNTNNEVTVSALLKTTKNSWTQNEHFDLNPRSPAISTPTEEVKQHTLGYSITGPIRSAYEDKIALNGKLLVIGDSDFLSDKYLRQNPENILFFQNIVDYLSIDEDLINIRSKGVTSRPIKDISDKTKATIRYVNIFGITFAVICFGMLRYYFRRKRHF